MNLGNSWLKSCSYFTVVLQFAMLTQGCTQGAASEELSDQELLAEAGLSEQEIKDGRWRRIENAELSERLGNETGSVGARPASSRLHAVEIEGNRLLSQLNSDTFIVVQTDAQGRPRAAELVDRGDTGFSGLEQAWNGLHVQGSGGLIAFFVIIGALILIIVSDYRKAERCTDEWASLVSDADLDVAAVESFTDRCFRTIRRGQSCIYLYEAYQENDFDRQVEGSALWSTARCLGISEMLGKCVSFGYNSVVLQGLRDRLSCER